MNQKSFSLTVLISICVVLWILSFFSFFVLDSSSDGGEVVSFARFPAVYPESYGAVGDGSTDDRAAIQAAIDAAVGSGVPGEVVFRAADYLIGSTPSNDSVANGIVVPYTAGSLGSTRRGVHLRFQNKTRLLAGNDNMVILRWSDGYGSLTGFPTLHANGHTGVWGLGVIPENMTQTTMRVFQEYNYFEVKTVGADEGIVLAGGPSVSGADSGCWYNVFHHFHEGGLRGIWLRPSITSGSIICNRNTFYGRVGNGVNTGVYIQSGSDNKFFTHFEGINSGTSPLATPTAIKVDLTDGTPGATNHGNKFYGVIEAATRWIDNESTGTSFLFMPIDESNSVFTARPEMVLGLRSSPSPAETQIRLTGSSSFGGVDIPNPISGFTVRLGERGSYQQADPNDGAGTYLANNLYYDGTDWRRIVTGVGSIVEIADGEIEFFEAQNGAAGSTATLTSTVRIDGESLRIKGLNGSFVDQQTFQEFHMLSAAATSDTATAFPENSRPDGTTFRITTDITGCDTVDTGVPGATARFGTFSALTNGTTLVSLSNFAYSADTPIRFTCVGGSGAFTGGVIEVSTFFHKVGPPTS